MNFKTLEFGLTLFCFVNNLFRKGFWKFWKQSHSIRSTCGYQIAMFNYSELALTQKIKQKGFSAMICWILLSDLGIFVLTFDMCSWHTHDCKLLHNIESIFFFLKIKEKKYSQSSVSWGSYDFLVWSELQFHWNRLISPNSITIGEKNNQSRTWVKLSRDKSLFSNILPLVLVLDCSFCICYFPLVQRGNWKTCYLRFL